MAQKLLKPPSNKRKHVDENEQQKESVIRKTERKITYFGENRLTGKKEIKDYLSANEPLWRTVESQFIHSTGFYPRHHQIEAVCRISTALEADAQKLRPINYLLQHATGSGKSLTVAAIVRRILDLKFFGGGDENKADGKHGFRLVLLLNDRLQLDSQLSEVVESFLLRSGVSREEIVKAYSTDVLESVLRRLNRKRKQEDIRAFISTVEKPLPRVVFSTIQKFPSLHAREGGFQQILSQGRIAIIADEAHRSHGKGISGQINSLFGGNPGFQPLGLVYISLTATPSQQALKIFGRPQRIGKRVVYAPFHHYPMSQAIADGVTINVLKDYTTVKTLVEWQSSEKGRLAKSQMGFVAAAVASHMQVLKYKAKYILRHFMNILVDIKQRRLTSKSDYNYQPKAMIVCRSRHHVLSFTQCLRAMIEKKSENIVKLGLFKDHTAKDQPRPSIYGAYSGDLEGVTETSLNKGLRLKDADIIVVCNKLETGYNEPLLGVMYVDRLLQGAKAVQVLSRLNRSYPGKEKATVVDFVNTADQLRQSFGEYWQETTWAGRGEFSEDGAEAEIEFLLNMKMDAIVSRILGSVEGLKNMTPKEAAESLITKMDSDVQDSLAQDLEAYIEACSRMSVQKIELPFAWASHLHRQLQSKKEESGQNISSDEIQDFVSTMSVDIKGIQTTHSGEIRILKPNQVLPTQKISEKERRASEHLTLAKMVENSYLRGGGTEHVKSLMRAIMNPDTRNCSDSSLILNILRRLDLVDMTLHYLEETKVGVIVKGLKNYPNEEVASLARNLVKRWKKLVSPTSPIFVSGVGDGSPAEAETREKIIIKMVDALSIKGDENDADSNSPSDIIKSAKAIEKEMFLVCSGATQEYRVKLRSLLFNLKDKKNCELRKNVLSGELTSSKLVRMSSDELANSDVASMRNELRKKKLEELDKWTQSQDSLGNSSDYTCSNCKSTKCYVNGTGTRGGWVSSQIEPSIIVTCCECNLRWEAN